MDNAQQPPQRDIIYRTDINVWDRAGNGPVTFDFSVAPYNLDFTPDAFYVKTVAYISKSEQNPNTGMPVLTCQFVTSSDQYHVLGPMSAGGSISNPNTLHNYEPAEGGTLGQRCIFEVRLLTTQGTTIANNSLSQSTSMCTLEFIKYGCNNGLE